MAPPEDGAGVDGSGYSGGSGTVKSLVNWTHTSHAQQGVEEGDRVAPQVCTDSLQLHEIVLASLSFISQRMRSTF